MEQDLSDRLDDIRDTLKSVHECLYGNGEPGSGLTDRVTAIELQFKWLMRIGGMVILLMASLFGIDKALKLDIFP